MVRRAGMSKDRPVIMVDTFTFLLSPEHS